MQLFLFVIHAVAYNEELLREIFSGSIPKIHRADALHATSVLYTVGGITLEYNPNRGR